MFTTTTMFVGSFRLIAGAPVSRGKRIFLSVLGGFLTGPENFDAAVLSSPNHYRTLVVRIYLLTVCHVCTGMLDAPVPVAAAMLWARVGIIFNGSLASIG